MISRLVPMLLAAVVTAGGAEAATVPTIAVFGFSLDNTSPAPSSPEELARTARLGTDLSAALQQSGKYRPVDMAASARLLKGTTDIRDCNGCELPVAVQLGASLAAYGWVQKVSNLILNINVVIEDSKTGKMVAGGSVDIRGNTDESWNRGLKFLIEEHVLRSR